MSKKQRKQPKGHSNFNDYDDEDQVEACATCRSYASPCKCEQAVEEKAERNAYVAEKAPRHNYQLGHVVTCKNTSMNGSGDVTGTIVQFTGADCHVLDGNHLIHMVRIISVVPQQK